MCWNSIHSAILSHWFEKKRGLASGIAFALFFDMGWGATAPMFMSTAADLFKGKIFGLIYGLIEGGIGVAGAFGAWMAGFIFDSYQSYQWAFALTIIVFIISCFFIWLAAPRKVRLY
ncbi:MAG: hypothetical protein JRH09_17305 [Deltaproteobacteria bacterium]|nr:hypothetical protein [Deltaproteobacteria bacterium]